MSEIRKSVVLHLTSLINGGAGKFTMDFHQRVLECGCSSYIAVRGKVCIYPDGTKHNIVSSEKFLINKLRRFIFRKIVLYSHIDEQYSMFNLCERFTCYKADDILAAMPQKPDVIFVHWVSDFVNAQIIRDLKNQTCAKIVFILVDHALYSGGCHYQFDCLKWKNGCRHCPATDSPLVRFGIARNFDFKKRYLPDDVFVISGEADRQRLVQSSIYKKCKFESAIVPIDEQLFCPSIDRCTLRQRWHLPVDKKLVLFGATSVNERRKGMKELLQAIPKVKCDNITYVVIGNVKDVFLPPNVICLGYLNEEQLVEAYQMADVFVCPTLADAGPMMVRQSIMCGTPVVAFPVGASVGFIKTGVTGYLAKYGDSEDLAKGIDYVVSLDDEIWAKMSNTCRKEAVNKYSTQVKGNTIEDLLSRLTK